MDSRGEETVVGAAVALASAEVISAKVRDRTRLPPDAPLQTIADALEAAVLAAVDFSGGSTDI